MVRNSYNIMQYQTNHNIIYRIGKIYFILSKIIESMKL